MIPQFEAKLKEYAHLLVEVGMNVQPGQTPRIAGPVECAPLVRLCAEAALDAGARDVIVDWTDDFVTRQRYLKADRPFSLSFPPICRKNSTIWWRTTARFSPSSVAIRSCSRGSKQNGSRPGSVSAEKEPAPIMTP